MEFSWSAEEQIYRDELREFIRSSLPTDWWQKYAYDGAANPKLMEFARGFGPTLAAKGHVVSHWPKAYGGRDASPWEQIILNEEVWSEGEPRSSLYMGANFVGPIIMMYGTEEQKQLHLNNIAQGKALWCQGFSEPEAGSDLAALRTRAERLQDGGGYVINGRKIWTSYVHSADWMLLLARVSASGREGITCFLLRINTPGLAFKTIKAVQAAHDIHETVFDNVRVDESARLGEEGKGWEIVTAALHFERIGQTHYENSSRGLHHAVDVLKKSERFHDSIVQAEAATCLAMLEAARLLVYKVIDQRARKHPPSAYTSVARIAMVRACHAVANFISSHLPEALTEGNGMDGRLQFVFKAAITTGIGAGAAEVQLNLISGRYLGLPKGP